jgi:uncharacterized protein YidB (DUF937 family)
MVQAFDADTIHAFAAHIKLLPQELARRLANALPMRIHQLTPSGVVQQLRSGKVSDRANRRK